MPQIRTFWAYGAHRDISLSFLRDQHVADRRNTGILLITEVGGSPRRYSPGAHRATKDAETLPPKDSRSASISGSAHCQMFENVFHVKHERAIRGVKDDSMTDEFRKALQAHSDAAQAARAAYADQPHTVISLSLRFDDGCSESVVTSVASIDPDTVAEHAATLTAKATTTHHRSHTDDL